MKAFIELENQVGVVEGDVMARFLLKPKEERAEELSMKMAVAFAEGCHQATNGHLEEIDNPLFFQAIKNAREIILEHSRPLSEQVGKIKQNIKELEYKIWEIEDKEHDNYMKAHELSCQMDKLGLFHGAEKRELKAQIEALRKPLEVPKEYQEQIDRGKIVIESYEEKIKEYDNLVRGCNWAEQELLLKGKNCKTAEKPQKAQKSQKEEKATTTKPTTKPSFKDQLKPLKSLK